jgi:hypothetical protein
LPDRASAHRFSEYIDRQSAAGNGSRVLFFVIVIIWIFVDILDTLGNGVGHQFRNEGG